MAATIKARLDDLNKLVAEYFGIADAPDPRIPIIQQIISARASRRKYLRADLFGEPDWDMLLDLYAARLKGQSVAITSLCIAANVPPTTALRHIKNMVDRGEIIRTPDETDQRRVFLGLSDETFVSITDWINNSA